MGSLSNITLKLNCSFFISAILFLIFSVFVKEQNNIQAYNIFLGISSLLFGFWLSFLPPYDSMWGFSQELIRLFIIFIILIPSLNFCIKSSISLHGVELIVKSIFSCICIIISCFYLISKFIDIFIWFKKIFKQIKEKLFNSVQPATSKAKALIENITAFLISIAGLGIAIKTIIEPLINLFK